MRKNSWVKNLTLVSQLGFNMITPILLCTLLGVFIDENLGTSPIFFIILMLLGVAAAFRNLFYHTTKEMVRQTKKKEEHNE